MYLSITFIDSIEIKLSKKLNEAFQNYNMNNTQKNEKSKTVKWNLFKFVFRCKGII